MSGPLDGLDWSPLELSGNPVPGDPSGVRRMSGQLTSLASEVSLQNRLLRSVGNSSESVWEGPAANKFHPAVKDLPGSLDKLVSSYNQAAGALEVYWPKLQDAQSRALEALQEARSAQADIHTAKGQVSNAQAQVSTNAQAYNSAVAAQTPVPGAPPPSPHAAAKAQAATNNAQAAYQQSQSQLSQAQANLTAASGRLAAAKQKAAQASSDGSNAATELATTVNAAAKVAPPKPHQSFWGSLWSDVTSVVSGGVHWVEHNAETIETVAATVTLGPAGLLLTSEGRQWLADAGHAIEHGLHDALPVLDVASGVLGMVSLGLAVVGFIPGVGEVADLANEGVTLIKTGVDVARLAGGEKDYADLGADALGLATGGESRLLTGAGDIAKTGEEAAQAGAKVESISREALSAGSKETEALSRADALGSEAERAEIGAKLTAGIDNKLSLSESLRGASLRGEEAGARSEAASARSAADAAEGQLGPAVTEAKNAESAASETAKSAVSAQQYTGARVLSMVKKNGLSGFVKESAGVQKVSDIAKPSTWAQYYKGWGGAALPWRLATQAVNVPNNAVGVYTAPSAWQLATGHGG